MITGPLDLQSHLSPPPKDLDVMSWISVAGIFLFFGLLGSGFVLAPGLAVGVNPGTSGGAIELPRFVGAGEGAAPASVVVSYRRDNVILFEGGMYSLRDLRAPMEAYARKNPGSVMLVRLDRQVSAQGLFDLCAMASDAGFKQVQLAAEQPEETGTTLLPPATR